MSSGDQNTQEKHHPWALWIPALPVCIFHTRILCQSARRECESAVLRFNSDVVFLDGRICFIYFCPLWQLKSTRRQRRSPSSFPTRQRIRGLTDLDLNRSKVELWSEVGPNVLFLVGEICFADPTPEVSQNYLTNCCGKASRGSTTIYNNKTTCNWQKFIETWCLILTCNLAFWDKVCKNFVS